MAKPLSERYTEEQVKTLVTETGFIEDENGCWIWQGKIATNGYAYISCNAIKYGVHRLAWEFSHQTSIPSGLVVRHSCDVPACCNPDHLLIGTHADNTRDKMERGRHARGESNGMAKITYLIAQDIRMRHLNGDSLHKITVDLGVNYRIVRRVVNNQQWHDNNYNSPMIKRRTRLTWELVREIRERHREANVTVSQLAQEYKVTAENIRFILLNKTWKE